MSWRDPRFSHPPPRPPQRQVAVALRYAPGRQTAPQVTAKGQGEIARRIEETARAHNVPVREDPDLAQVLVQLDLGSVIPKSLYTAVAEVLAFVYRMNGRAALGDSDRPSR